MGVGRGWGREFGYGERGWGGRPVNMTPSAGAAGAVRFAFPEVTSRSKASASPGQVRTACTAVTMKRPSAEHADG